MPGAGAPVIKLPAAGLKASEPLTLEGTGTPGSTVTVYDGDPVVGETIVAPDGTWQITLPPPAAGAHSLVARQLGADGKEQAVSAPVELTVADGQIVVATPAVVAEATAATGMATAVPSAAPGAGKAPEIKRPVAAALKAGEPVVLEGTGEPGTTVTLYDGDQVVAETVVAPDGTWTITVPPLAAGTHSLAAKLLGAGGKEQAASAPLELTVADGKIVVATPAAVAQATAATGAATPVPGGAAAPTVEPTSATAAGAATSSPHGGRSNDQRTCCGGHCRRSDRCGNGSQRSAVNRRHPGRQRAGGCDAGRRCRRCGPDHDARGYGRAGSNGQGL